MKHTQGEWKVKKHFKGELNAFYLSDPNNAKTPAEAEANAKLIAAAPDLLEALKNMVNLSYDTARPTEEEKDFNMRKAIYAINKATN